MSRKALLKRQPRKIATADGESILARSLTLGEALRFDELANTDARSSLQYLVAQCVLDDETGEPMFAGPDDPAILDIPIDMLREIGEKLTKLSSSGKIESAEKNSEGTNLSSSS